jgi:hypothetical protein
MKKDLNFILMADIIASGKADQHKLMRDFKEITVKTNGIFKPGLLSPLTITLGDEFQSVARDLGSALAIIFHLEESTIEANKDLKFRYVLVEGMIETPINPKIAYEMLGTGLTRARLILAQLKKTSPRFQIVLRDKNLGNALQKSFLVGQEIIDSWNIKRDQKLVSKFLQLKDYKQVAMALKKDRSLMWKRAKSLRLEQYFALKEVVKYLGEK